MDKHLFSELILFFVYSIYLFYLQRSTAIIIDLTFSVVFFLIVVYRDLGLHALHNVGLFDPNALIHHNHEDICKNALHLSNEQRRICTRSPRVFAVS